MSESWTTADVWPPMRVIHLLIKFDNPSLYSWWDLCVQCNTCCLGHNVLGWDICHKNIKTTCPPLICTHKTVSRILYMYTKQQYSVQLLPEIKQWLAWLHPCCPGPTPCQLCIFLMTCILQESAYFVFFQWTEHQLIYPLIGQLMDRLGPKGLLMGKKCDMF